MSEDRVRYIVPGLAEIRSYAVLDDPPLHWPTVGPNHHDRRPPLGTANILHDRDGQADTFDGQLSNPNAGMRKRDARKVGTMDPDPGRARYAPRHASDALVNEIVQRVLQEYDAKIEAAVACALANSEGGEK